MHTTLSNLADEIETGATERQSTQVTVELADEQDREAIYGCRHAVYAGELRQHAVNGTGKLRDSLDESNLYLVVKTGGELAGFISVTPPRKGAYSIDKYFSRESLPWRFDDRLYEVRLLTVLKP